MLFRSRVPDLVEDKKITSENVIFAKQQKRSFLVAFVVLSGRRDSNSRPLAWKANALSTELLPQLAVSNFKFKVSS